MTYIHAYMGFGAGFRASGIPVSRRLAGQFQCVWRASFMAADMWVAGRLAGQFGDALDITTRAARTVKVALVNLPLHG